MIKIFKMITWVKIMFHKTDHRMNKTVKSNSKSLRITVTQIFLILLMNNTKEEVVGKILAKKVKKFHMKSSKKEEEFKSITRTLTKSQRKRNRDH